MTNAGEHLSDGSNGEVIRARGEDDREKMNTVDQQQHMGIVASHEIVATPGHALGEELFPYRASHRKGVSPIMLGMMQSWQREIYLRNNAA